MSVYVDELLKHGGSESFRWEHSCHLYADSLDELHAFAEGLGLKRQWFQDKAGFSHYDLTVGKRAMAVKRGAMERDRYHAVNFSRAQRGLLPMCDGAPGDGQHLNAGDSPIRVGKRAAGRLLDGRTWDEYPEVRA